MKIIFKIKYIVYYTDDIIFLPSLEFFYFSVKFPEFSVVPQCKGCKKYQWNKDKGKETYKPRDIWK